MSALNTADLKKQLAAQNTLHPLLWPGPAILAPSQSFSPTPHFFFYPSKSQGKRSETRAMLKGSKKNPLARKEVKKFSIEECAKVATWPGLISVNVSPLISFTSRGYCGSVLCWKAFSKLQMPHCFSGPLCEQGVGMFCVWDEPWPLLPS